MKKHKVFFVIDLCLSVFLTGLILVFSLANGSTSGEQSSTVTRLVNDAFSLFTPSEVKEIPLTKIEVDIPSKMEYLDTLALTPSFLPTDASDTQVHYSSSDQEVASIDSEGTLKANGVGSCQITVSSTRYPEVSQSYPLTVTGKEITSIELDDTVVIQKNQVSSLTYQLAPSNTYQRDVILSTSATDLQILDEKYLFSTLPGEYPLTLTSKDKPSVSKTVTVKVEDKNPGVLADDFTVSYPDTIPLNQEFQLSYQFASMVTEKTIKTTCADSEKIKETDTGFIALEEGDISFSITYLATGLNKTITIHAYSIPVNQITIKSSTSTYRVGDIITFTIDPEPASAISPQVNWNIDKEEHGKFNSDGKLLLLKAGKVTVTATGKENNSLTASLTITIKNKSFFTKEGLKQAESFIRKAVGHFSLFLVLGFFLFLTYYHLCQLNQTTGKKFLLWLSLASLIYCFLIAGSSEICQALTDNRGPSFGDVMLDTSGSLVGILIILGIVFLLLRPKKKKTNQ